MDRTLSAGTAVPTQILVLAAASRWRVRRSRSEVERSSTVMSARAFGCSLRVTSPCSTWWSLTTRKRAIEVVKTKLGEFDASGRRRPVLTEEIRRFECDSVILAVGESVDPDFARSSGLKLNQDGTLEIGRASCRERE